MILFWMGCWGYKRERESERGRERSVQRDKKKIEGGRGLLLLLAELVTDWRSWCFKEKGRKKEEEVLGWKMSKYMTHHNPPSQTGGKFSEYRPNEDDGDDQLDMNIEKIVAISSSSSVIPTAISAATSNSASPCAGSTKSIKTSNMGTNQIRISSHLLDHGYGSTLQPPPFMRGKTDQYITNYYRVGSFLFPQSYPRPIFSLVNKN